MSDADRDHDISMEALIEHAPDAVILADRAGVIRAWNAAAERFRDAHWEGFERAIGDGRTRFAGRSLPTRALRADGEQFYVELSFAIVRSDDGAVGGALATARDITERFEQDRANRRRLAELEESLKKLQSSDS